DTDTVVVAKEDRDRGNRETKTIELVTLNRDEIDAALKIAAEGGDPTASRLPPLAQTTLKGVKEVVPPSGRIGWKLAIEAGTPPRLTLRRQVRANSDDIQAIAIGPTQAIVVSLALSEEGGPKNRVHVERFDLMSPAAGKDFDLFQAAEKKGHLEHLDMP